MDVIRLRSLTRKSKLGFGKHANLSIQDMINVSMHAYLRWVYFFASNITFTDDILSEIGITNKYRISKPGIDKKKFNQIFDEYGEKLPYSKKRISEARKKSFKHQHIRRIRNVYRDNLPAKLQRKNQGH